SSGENDRLPAAGIESACSGREAQARMTVTHAAAVPPAEARSKRVRRKSPHSSMVPEFTRHTTVATTSASLAEYLETAVTRSSNVLWSAMPSSLLDDVLRGPPVSVYGRVMRQGPTRASGLEGGCLAFRHL